MALAPDLMGQGLPQQLATMLGWDSASTPNSVTAAGTTQGTATALKTNYSLVTSASSQTGVILTTDVPLASPVFVLNSATLSTATMVLYPPTGGSLNGGAANAGLNVDIGSAVIVYRLSTTTWAVFSTNGTSGVPGVSGQTASPRTIAIGGLVPAVSTDFNDSTPATTEVYLGEILVPCNMLTTGVAVFNGSDVTGNVKFGLYDSTGALIAQTASTAGSGTDAYQRIAWTAALTILGPATYYIAGSYSSATARYNSPILGSFGASKVTGQVYGTLPATVTPPTTFTTILSNIASLY